MAKKRIGITIGDPAGIGPEIIAKSLAHADCPQDVEWVIFGDLACAGQYCGKPDKASARIAFQALVDALAQLRSAEIDAVVTAPVSKFNLSQVGFGWPGQTEFFAEGMGVEDYAMCLSGNNLKVVLASIHAPLRQACSDLSQVGIERVSALMIDYLQRLGHACPRLAVLGLNPHAGENGNIGREELEIIAPAIAALQQQYGASARISGPHVPDAIFRDALQGHYDGLVAMYHDQGLIPLKMVDFDNAVNITLGLPRPRLSPDHGTAYHLAGRDIASFSSMLSAMQLAVKIS